MLSVGTSAGGNGNGTGNNNLGYSYGYGNTHPTAAGTEAGGSPLFSREGDGDGDGEVEGYEISHSLPMSASPKKYEGDMNKRLDFNSNNLTFN